MKACMACLEDLDEPGPYHGACLEQLFRSTMPVLRLTRADLPEQAAEAIGKMSISGAQPKASLQLSDDRRELLVANTGRQYILKPQIDAFRHTPENEQLTMNLARRCGIDIPPLGLIPMSDGELAYVIRRFDRSAEGQPLHVEDLCGLALLPPEQKYEGTVELLAELVARHSTARTADLAQLYRRIAFCYLTGNGDMHLKNFALLRHGKGRHRLSPAYDLLCTALYGLGESAMALSMRHWRSGDPKIDDLTGKDFLAYASRCALSQSDAQAILDDLLAHAAEAHDLVQRSFMPDEMKEKYGRVLLKRGRALRQGLAPTRT